MPRPEQNKKLEEDKNDPEDAKRVNLVITKKDFDEWTEWSKKIASGNMSKFIKISVEEKIDMEKGYEYQIGDEFKFLSDEKKNAINFFNHNRLEMVTSGANPKNFTFILQRSPEDDREGGIQYTIVVLDMEKLPGIDEEAYYEMVKIPFSAIVQHAWLASLQDEKAIQIDRDALDSMIIELEEGLETSPLIKRSSKFFPKWKDIEGSIVAHLEFRMTQSAIKIMDNFNTDPSYYYRNHPDNLEPEPPIEIPQKYRMKVPYGTLPESFPLSKEVISFPITVNEPWKSSHDGIASTMVSILINIGKTRDIYKYHILLTCPATMSADEFKENCLLFYNMLPPMTINEEYAVFFTDERLNGEIEKKKIPRMQITGR